MVISNAEIQMTRAIHLHSPGYHLITSWGKEEMFLAREKVSYNSLQLVPNAHTFLTQTQQVWDILDDESSCFRTAIFLHYIIALPSTYFLSQCLFLSYFVTFLHHVLSFSSSSLLINCRFVWAWERSEAMSVPSPILLCWPPTLPCCFFCPAIN